MTDSNHQSTCKQKHHSVSNRTELCPWTCLHIYLSLQSWEENSSSWILTLVWAVIWAEFEGHKARDGRSGTSSQLCPCQQFFWDTGCTSHPCRYGNIASYYIFLPGLTSSSGSPSEKSLPSLPHLLRVLSARPRQDLKHMRLRALLSGGWELSLNFTSRSIGWHQDSRRLLLWEHTYVSMSLH